MDAETFFGGRVLLAIGAFVLLLGVGFFIKYAFDNNWVGPTGRVAIGLIAGIAFISGGEYLLRTGQRVYAGGLTGLGGAILYLSLWAAGNGFHLVPTSATFIAMVVVTGALLTLSIARDSEITAAFALLGGFITPLLNVTATPQPLQLFIYIAILDATLAFLPVNRRWPRIQGTAFIFTQLYVLDVFAFPPALPIVTFVGFTTLYLALFVWQPFHKTIRTIALDAYEAALVVLSACAYYLALHGELYEAHRHWLTAAVIVLAALYVTFARLAKDPMGRSVFAVVGLALITGGVAITFSGNAVPLLWAIEGALLGWIGIHERQNVVQAFGIAALALGILHIMAQPPQGGALFANERFLALAVFSAAFFTVYRVATQSKEIFRFPYVAYEPIGHVFALVALSYELYYWTGTNELSLTLLWLVYAPALFSIGLLRRSSFVRWEGFALLAIAILKAFIVDMSEVNPGIRIVSFLALGSVMLAISYAYQRHTKRATGTTP
ncbi:MAG TPA: DUF2339 domain-containing protein [Candidatus Tyrphobacter sp.]